MSFGNPLGFLALLAIPAVVLIHLLQVRSRLVRVTTLFLLDPHTFERDGGRKIDRLRTSKLLWLQLLAVLFATWVLVEPRWLREDTTLRLVLVIDGSASMSAYREEAADALDSYLPEVERSADAVEWIVMGSDPAAPTLYRGDDRASAESAALGWQSYLGVHDIDTSLSLGSSLAGPRGLVVLLTDHVPEPRADVEVLAVGSPVDNVGVVSVSIEEGSWRAIVKNSGSSPQRRSWWVEADGVAGTRLNVDIEPGRVRFLSGELPPEAQRMELVLEADRFTIDDRLPFLAPREKTLRVHVAPSLQNNELVARFLATLEPVELSAIDNADLSIGRAGPVASIVFAELAPGYRDGPIVTESVELVEGLDFRGLVARNGSMPPELALSEDSRALVWQGDDPLIWLDETARTSTLAIGFSLDESNASRIPAFVLALHRYASDVRRAKRSFSQNNVETAQLLEVAADVVERAPREPGFFEIGEDGAGEPVLFRGAAHFADVREGDLSRSQSREPDGSIVRDALLLNSLPDPLTSLWLLLLMGIAAYAWVVQEKGA